MIGRVLPGRFGPLLAAVPGLLVLVGHWAIVRPAFVDDGYIFYRYAANLGDGHGLVFNLGEQVEGYSSLLWTLILAAVHALGGSLPTVAPVLGVVAAAACLVTVAYAAREAGGSVALGALSALAVALCTGFAFYAANGMDAPLFALVLTAAVFAAAVHARGAGGTVALGVALVGLVVVRAEGFAYALAIAAVLALIERRQGRRALIAPSIAVVATVIAFVVRQAVYGVWLPATVTAKGYFAHVVADGDLHAAGSAVKNGLEYEGPLVLVLLALVALSLVVAARRSPPVPPLVWLAAVAVALNVVVAVLNSGDWMEHRRLLVPALPLLAVLAPWSGQVLAGLLPAGARRVAALAAPPLACALLVAGAGVDPRSTPRDPDLTAIGAAIDASSPEVRVLTNVAGVIPWYAGSETYVWDILGLTDAHNSRHGEVFSPRYGRTDPDYDFSRPFDVFVSNAPLDPALMVNEWERTPERFADYSIFVHAPWTRRQIIVVARRGSAVEAALESACGCGSERITPRLRALLLARAKRAGAPLPG